MSMQTLLELSTGHVPEDVFFVLRDNPGIYPWTASADDYGVMLSVPGEESWAEFTDRLHETPIWHPALIRVLAVASLAECAWLRLDEDGEFDQDLPIFDW